MHSFWQRLNALFFYALSVLGFLSFMAAGTTYWHTADPKIELKLEKLLLCVRTSSRPPASRARIRRLAAQSARVRSQA